MIERGRRRLHTRDARHWDDPVNNPLSLGCSNCPDLRTCGGLHVRSDAFDCTSYCCGTPTTCDAVCRLNSHFIHRMWEVSGFDLARVPRLPDSSFPWVPNSVPLVYSRGTRRAPFAPAAVALVLYQLISRRTGTLKFPDLTSICTHFGIQPGTPIVLTGTGDDRPLERWWELGERRLPILRQLAGLGIHAATSPNFSVFSDQPRWDDLHSIKRIAICWQEMAAAGLPSALHVNGRTLRDWQRWTAFVRERPEVSALAYEFATGATGLARQADHVRALCELADAVPRPLTIIVRGGFPHLGILAQSFARVALIDSTTHMKTANRFRGLLAENGPLSWLPCEERPLVDIDGLMQHNYLTMANAVARAIAPDSVTMEQRAAS